MSTRRDITRYGILAALVASCGVLLAQEVTNQHLLDGLKQADRWLTYSGDYSGKRHTPLTQITPANVHRLTAKWVFQTGVAGKFEAVPILMDGLMYITGPDNHAWALDARAGRQIWRYRRDLPERMNVCCGRVNRGFAVYKNRLYMTTLDAHLVALDPKSGGVIWDVEIDDYRRGYSATAAPLVVKDKIVTGIAGAEYGVRGFIDAYDPETGKRAWRFWTVPEPEQPGSDTWSGESWKWGGGSTWITGTYDPELNLVYWGTGNPGPDLYGDSRKGDNLYTDSVVALDADTGRLRWHYQFTPHDTHDWDAVQVPVLADVTVDRQPRKALMLANRNGFFYTLDRTNGKLIAANPFVRTTWAEKIGPDGRPIVLANSEPTEGGTPACPDVTGGTNWTSPSFNPTTGLFYVTAREVCATYYGFPQEFQQGQYFFGGAAQRTGGRGYSALRAIDPLTATVKWQFAYFSPSLSGTLSTASGLVFGGDADGNIMAFDAKIGKNLWHFQTGAPVYAAPVSYMLDGQQYLAVASGMNLFTFALPQDAPATRH